MIWLSRLASHSGYLTAAALPMVLIGAGQGVSLSPLTAAGVIRVRPTDAGAVMLAAALAIAEVPSRSTRSRTSAAGSTADAAAQAASSRSQATVALTRSTCLPALRASADRPPRAATARTSTPSALAAATTIADRGPVHHEPILAYQPRSSPLSGHAPRVTHPACRAPSIVGR
jgi:hypothetical protein